ncbi:hypothetical protein LHU53_05430 [Rhodoferax sp. U2-2l]|uniref:hypothetical protein n=1 Tax=Rhodoferax sp. U2-2l TaxID=2884000 RepID=UPI001D0BAF03|nr:hypothetical protein [Rhodoferax sp. U2-2l]MCB8746343.1 hypothetical protein [Rhodoferax sp. U2-2l]
MNDERSEITALKRTRWRTAISARAERFSQLLDNKTIASKYFGEKYVEALSNRINRIGRTLLVLAVAYLILMLSLFAAQDSGKNEFEFFGYGFKNLGYHKEILLFLAASLSPVSATLSGYQRYLVALRAECLKRLAPIAEVRDFYSSALLDNYFDAFAKPYDYKNSRPHLATTSLAFVLIGIMLIVILTLFAGSFLLQLNVIYDVATRPSTSRVVNLFVVGYALAAIFLAWTISIMQLPLPEVDVSNYRRLSELQASDPEKYKETLTRLARGANRREDAWSLALGFVASILTVAAVTFLFGRSTQAIEMRLSQGLGAVFLAILFAKPAADLIKKATLNWFFEKYPADTTERLHAYGFVKRALLTARLVIPAAIAALFLLLQYSRQ